MNPDTLLPELAASPEIQAFAAGFPVTLMHAGATALLLFLGAALHAMLTPWREIALIREGNSAAAVAFGGVMIGLAIPLAMSLAASTSIREIAIWGVATIFVQLLVFRLTDMVLRGLPQRIVEGEVAAAVLLVSAKIATALVIAAAVAG